MKGRRRVGQIYSAVLIVPVICLAWYLHRLASQFTCLFFGHHICSGYQFNEIFTQIEFTIEKSELSSFLLFAGQSLAVTLVAMGIVRLYRGAWVPFRFWLLIPWAPVFGFYYTHFLVFGEVYPWGLLDWLLPESMPPLAGYPAAFLFLFVVYVMIPALPLALAALLLDRRQARQKNG